MKFGHFIYQINLDEPDTDSKSIEEGLYEGRLAEHLGYDALWFAEHHFTGETSYGDPIVFATAIAMQTQKIGLGFAVLEMAMHHPIRVAVQTSLLDNLSKGRLMVGTSRGSSLNAFEYQGFGTSVKKGRDSIDEAEELIIKAWTSRNELKHEGEHWTLSFPSFRPMPFQKPHPPLFRGATSRESVVAMAKKGRLILLRTNSAAEAKEYNDLYLNTMLNAGFKEELALSNFGRTWFWRDCFVAESDNEAHELFFSGLESWRVRIDKIRNEWNSGPSSQGILIPQWTMPDIFYDRPPAFDGTEPLIGSPKRVREQIQQLSEAGVSNVMLSHLGGIIPLEKRERSMRLLASQVFPSFTK